MPSKHRVRIGRSRNRVRVNRNRCNRHSSLNSDPNDELSVSVRDVAQPIPKSDGNPRVSDATVPQTVIDAVDIKVPSLIKNNPIPSNSSNLISKSSYYPQLLPSFPFPDTTNVIPSMVADESMRTCSNTLLYQRFGLDTK